METNIYWFFIVALVPLIVGSVWYNPKIGLGKAWVKSTGLREEELRGGNMLLIFFLTYLLGLFLCAVLYPLCIHQVSLNSILVGEAGYGDPDSAVMKTLADLQRSYGDNDRTFGHGALHGAVAALGLALPILTINGLFERRSWKYIIIHAGYWLVTLALMGGLISQYV